MFFEVRKSIVAVDGILKALQGGALDEVTVQRSADEVTQKQRKLFEILLPTDHAFASRSDDSQLIESKQPARLF